MNNEGKVVPAGQRIYWLDNLRTFAIFLVVLIHAGIVYESSGIGAIFWIVDDPSTHDLIGIINLLVDIFVMPTLFFISGYLILQSLEHRSRWDFVKAKFKRLMIPWAVAVFTLIPVYKVMFLYSRGLPPEHWSSYFHFSNGIYGQNWLWFLPVLFLFNLLYVLLASWGWVPAKMSFKLGILLTFVVSVASSVAIDLLNAEGWTKTALIDFQNERLLVYFMLFLLGSLGFQQGIFASRPRSKKLYIAVHATAWIPVGVYTVLLIIWLLKPDFMLISPAVGSFIFWLSFYVSVLSLMYLTIETFRFYLDRPGRIWEELNKNSYYVYIIHVIVLGGIALVLLNTTLPALLKYLILATSTYVASNVVVSLSRRAFGARAPIRRASEAGSA
jgi:fucose 4-O-acetylase-like acetyltransferase